jgi:uncharacterized protein (DUF362 family)
LHFGVRGAIPVVGGGDVERFNRRELVKLAGLAVLAGPSGGGGVAIPHRGRVGVARLPESARQGGLTDVSARAALERALVAATGASSAHLAIASLFRPTDTVGLKLNCLGGSRMSPRPPVVAALAGLLREAGIPGSRIIAFDRSSRELERAGFAVRRRGDDYLCYGIDNAYEQEPSGSGAIGSCFARLVATECTALISVGVVKDHDLAGVSAGLKNWYGVIHNPNKYHDNGCDPYVADVLQHPYLSGKLRLTVLDGAVAQCHGGPAYRADAVWPLGVLAVATDPVAADAWAWKVIDQERQRRGLPTLAQAKRAPGFLATAAGSGLGVGDPAKVVEVMA